MIAVNPSKMLDIFLLGSENMKIEMEKYNNERKKILYYINLKEQ